MGVSGMARWTALRSPILGVVPPPTARFAHNSILFAPARTALVCENGVILMSSEGIAYIEADSTESTQTSSTNFFIDRPSREVCEVHFTITSSVHTYISNKKRNVVR